MRVSHPRLRARRLLLRRRFFFWRWLSGNCCLVINSVVYQMPQGIVDTYPTLTISLHRSKNKPWLSCPNISAIRPQAVVVAREHRLLCTTQTKRNRKAEPWKVDVKREDKVRVKSNLCDAKSFVHVGRRPLRVLRAASRLRHPPFNTMTPLVTSSRCPKYHRRPPPLSAAASTQGRQFGVRAKDDVDASNVTQTCAACVDGLIDDSSWTLTMRPALGMH